MDEPNGISWVTWASEPHSASTSPMLGLKMPAKPRRSISEAISNVVDRRPGMATRETAG